MDDSLKNDVITLCSVLVYEDDGEQILVRAELVRDKRDTLTKSRGWMLRVGGDDEPKTLRSLVDTLAGPEDSWTFSSGDDKYMIERKDLQSLVDFIGELQLDVADMTEDLARAEEQISGTLAERKRRHCLSVKEDSTRHADFLTALEGGPAEIEISEGVPIRMEVSASFKLPGSVPFSSVQMSQSLAISLNPGADLARAEEQISGTLAELMRRHYLSVKEGSTRG